MLNQSPNASMLEEVIGRPDPPPLRIHHIMVATAVIAVLLSISQFLRQSNTLGLSAFVASGQGILMTITAGLAATVTGFGFVWRRHGHSYFNQPGHWLLVAQSLMVSVFLLAALISAMRLPDNHAVTSAATSVFFVLLNVVLIGLNLWAAAKIADSIPWKLLFLVDGLMVVGMFGIAWLVSTDLVPVVLWGAPLATFLLLLLAAWGDRRDHIRRDWPHWLGVGLKMVTTLQMLGRPIWAWVAGLFTA